MKVMRVCGSVFGWSGCTTATDHRCPLLHAPRPLKYGGQPVDRQGAQKAGQSRQLLLYSYVIGDSQEPSLAHFFRVLSVWWYACAAWRMSDDEPAPRAKPSARLRKSPIEWPSAVTRPLDYFGARWRLSERPARARPACAPRRPRARTHGADHDAGGAAPRRHGRRRRGGRCAHSVYPSRAAPSYRGPARASSAPAPPSAQLVGNARRPGSWATRRGDRRREASAEAPPPQQRCALGFRIRCPVRKGAEPRRAVAPSPTLPHAQGRSGGPRGAGARRGAAPRPAAAADTKI